jgi:5,6,7,8-tetrahydromethanopterin hydro-lyase
MSVDGATGVQNGFETQFGESFVGDGVNAAHINTVLGARGGPVEVAWASALAQPRQGHVAFVTVVRPGLPVKPFTLFVNKSFISGDRHAEMTWGPAQAGVATGVADAVADETVDRNAVDRLLLIAAVWVNPAADDAEAVYVNNVRATYQSLRAGQAGHPPLNDVLSVRHAPCNPFFRPSGPR